MKESGKAKRFKERNLVIKREREIREENERENKHLIYFFDLNLITKIASQFPKKFASWRKYQSNMMNDKTPSK